MFKVAKFPVEPETVPVAVIEGKVAEVPETVSVETQLPVNVVVEVPEL